MIRGIGVENVYDILFFDMDEKVYKIHKVSEFEDDDKPFWGTEQDIWNCYQKDICKMCSANFMDGIVPCNYNNLCGMKFCKKVFDMFIKEYGVL